MSDACRRCGADEWRIHGYCSVRCEDLAEVEEERDEARAELARARAVIGEFLLAEGGPDAGPVRAAWRADAWNALVRAQFGSDPR